MRAQPLIVPNITVSGGTTHDLVILAPMANTILAYDADDGRLIWNLKLGTPIKSFRGIDQWLINDNWGILSTPVIDSETNTMYCDSWSSPDGSLASGGKIFVPTYDGRIDVYGLA